MKRFLVDKMLGRLARWLRLLGLDAPLVDRPPVIVPPGCVFLTRRHAWQSRPGVLFVLADHLDQQLIQVITDLDILLDESRLFTRCLDCNLPVYPVTVAEVAHMVPDHVIETADHFTVCPGCGRVFWPGSHGRRAMERLRQFF